MRGFKTKEAAEKAEKKLYLVVERELVEAERKGCLWSTLLGEWELAARGGKDIFQKQLSPNTVDDYTIIIKTHCKDWMNLHATEIDRTLAWKTLDTVEREVSVSRRKRLRTAIETVYRWAILAGKIKEIKSLPTEGFKGRSPKRRRCLRS